MGQSDEDGLYRFLEKRNVPASLIDKMKEDKIDKDVVKMMSDVNLARYLPSHGDRIALMNYCISMGKSSDKRKKDLLVRLQKKLKLRREKAVQDQNQRKKNRATNVTNLRVIPMPARKAVVLKLAGCISTA